MSNSQSRSAWTRWIVPVATVTLMVVSTLSRSLTRDWYSRSAYFLIWVPFLLWIGSIHLLISKENWKPSEWVKKGALNLGVAALLTTVVAVSIEPTLRVLSDEANVMAVSRSMLQEKRVDNITHGYQYYFTYHVEDALRGGVEKHTLLFPFLTQLVHAVSGYRVENAYVVNLILFFLLLLLVHMLIVGRAGPGWAVAAQILVTASPIVTLTARSGGVDLLSAVGMVLCLWAILLVCENASLERQIFLITSLVMWVNTRQEVPLAAAITLGILAITGRIHWKALWETSFPLRLLILGLVPIFWQRYLVQDPFETGPHETAFSIHNFLSNNLAFLKQMTDFKFYCPYSQPILWLGYVGVFWIAARWIRSRPRLHRPGSLSPWDTILLAGGAAVASQWMVLTAYFRGVPDHPSDARYFTPFCVILAVLAVWTLKRLVPAKVGSKAGVGIALVIMVMYHPIAIEGKFINAQIAVRYHAFTIDFLKRNAAQNALIVSGRPGHYAIYNYGSAGFDFANKNYRQLLNNLRNHLFADIFVIQEIDPSTRRPKPGQGLRPEYVLDPVAMMQNGPNDVIQISLVEIPKYRLSDDGLKPYSYRLKPVMPSGPAAASAPNATSDTMTARVPSAPTDTVARASAIVQPSTPIDPSSKK